MGAGSFLALVARHSLLPVRQYSSKAPAQVHNIDTHFGAQLAEQQLLSSFHLDLAERLQLLRLHGSGNAHLNWLLDALASTLSTHSSLQLALAASSSSYTLAKQARADEVLCMLDVCTSLKQVADDMDRQFGCLHHALQSVGHALKSDKPLSLSGRGRIRAAARRLSACLMKDRPHTSILCITGKQYRPLAEARASLLLAAQRDLHSADATPHPAAAAIDGAMLTSLLVLASAVSSLAPPSPGKSFGTITGACKMIIKYLGAKSVSNAASIWAGPLRQLHHDLRQEEMSATGGAFFQEVQGLHFAATKLHATITNPGALDHGMEQQLPVVKQSVESLRKNMQEAQGCITMFRIHMASFFQALVALRSLSSRVQLLKQAPTLASRFCY